MIALLVGVTRPAPPQEPPSNPDPDEIEPAPDRDQSGGPVSTAGWCLAPQQSQPRLRPVDEPRRLGR